MAKSKQRQTISNEFKVVELVFYDPDNYNTYPSVCVHKEEVEQRFGFTGGEQLLFDEHGNYLGELVKRLGVGTDLG